MAIKILFYNYTLEYTLLAHIDKTFKMIRKLTTLDDGPPCPYNLLYRFLTKICKAEFLDTQLLVLYLGSSKLTTIMN